MLTNKCNLRCSHCIRMPFQKEEEISNENLDIVLSRIQEFGLCEAIFITGGEPTFHPQFQYCLEKIYNSFQGRISVCTNGVSSFYQMEDISFLTKFPKVVWQVSLDGNENSHDAIRGKGTFKKALYSIERLSALHLRVDVSTVVNTQNKSSILSLHEQLKTRDVYRWLVSFEMPFGRAKDRHSIPSAEWNLFVDEVLNFSTIPVRIPKLYDFEKLSNLTDEQINQLVSQSKPHCGSCSSKIYISPDLTVFPCTCLTKYPLGNLLTENLNDILLSPLACYVRNHPMQAESPCNSCRYFPICQGGCLGISEHFFGILNAGDVRCPIFQRSSSQFED